MRTQFVFVFCCVRHWQGRRMGFVNGFGRRIKIQTSRHCNSNVPKGASSYKQLGAASVAEGTHMLLLSTVRFMHM